MEFILPLIITGGLWTYFGICKIIENRRDEKMYEYCSAKAKEAALQGDMKEAEHYCKFAATYRKRPY